MPKRRTGTCSKKEQDRILNDFIKRRSEAFDGIHILMNPNLSEEERLRLLEVQTPRFLAYLFPEAVIKENESR